MADDDRLMKALEHANYKATIATQRQNLKLRYENSLLIGCDGGTFRVNFSLLSFVDLLIRNGQTQSTLIDEKENPILIHNLTEFYEDCLSTYHEAANEYQVEWEKLRKSRSVVSLVGLNTDND